MKIARSFNLNIKAVLVAVGFVTLAGNILLANKIWNLWPAVVSIFFASLKIYTTLCSILDQFIS